MNIAFVGKAGSGKTTLADYLNREHCYLRVSFAAKVKYYAELILNRPIKKHLDRVFLQLLGEGARRSEPRVWIDFVKRQLDELEDVEFTYPYVLDDCRYLNEAKFLRKRGFILIRVVGRGETLLPESSEHSSETEQLRILTDYTIANIGTKQEAFEILESVLNWYGKYEK